MVFKSKFQAMWSAVQETLATLADVNKVIRSVDPLVFRFTWFRAILQGCTTLGGFALAGFAIDQVASGYLSQEKITMNMMFIGAGVFAAYFLTRGVMQEFMFYREGIFRTELESRLDVSVVKKIKTLDLGRLSDPEFMTLRESARYKGKGSIMDIFTSQTQLISAVVGVGISLSAVLVLDPILVVLAFVPFFPQIALAFFLNRKRIALWEAERHMRRQKGEYESCVVRNSMVVQNRLLRFSEHMLGRFVEFAQVFQNSRVAMYRLYLHKSLLLGVLRTLVMTIVVAYLGSKLVSGEFGFAKAFLIFGCMNAFSSALSGFSHAISSIDEERMNYRYWTDFHKTEPLIDESSACAFTFQKTPWLELKDVSFAYPGKDNLVLKECSLAVEPGEKVALVGRNGCGKTTILRLLTKTFTPTKGAVLVDGMRTKDILQDSLLGTILCVTQGSEVPNLKIAEALTGRDLTQVDYSRLHLACEMSGANEFIGRLPHGYATQIGSEWPDGVGFSAGQTQRLKLAAAFYRLLDPEVRVALFDEPMSHCDSETKEQFYSAIQMVQGKTVIVVLHDPLYLNYFERVVEVREGCVQNDVRGRKAIEGFRHDIMMSLSNDLS